MSVTCAELEPSLIREECRVPVVNLPILMFSGKCQSSCTMLGCKHRPHEWMSGPHTLLWSLFHVSSRNMPPFIGVVLVILVIIISTCSICTTVGDMDSQAVLLPNWTGWEVCYIVLLLHCVVLVFPMFFWAVYFHRDWDLSHDLAIPEHCPILSFNYLLCSIGRGIVVSLENKSKKK